MRSLDYFIFENAVGVHLTWRPHLETYFALGSVVYSLSHGSAYLGKENAEVPYSNCESIGNYRCSQYCMSKVIFSSTFCKESMKNKLASTLEFSLFPPLPVVSQRFTGHICPPRCGSDL